MIEGVDIVWRDCSFHKYRHMVEWSEHIGVAGVLAPVWVLIVSFVCSLSRASGAHDTTCRFQNTIKKLHCITYRLFRLEAKQRCSITHLGTPSRKHNFLDTTI